MDRGLALGDRAASQILGFIVGLAVVTAALAIASYFIVTVPDSGADEETQQLEGDTHRAIETLTTTPGEPNDWGDDFSNDTLRRVGLLEPGSHESVARAKIDRLQSGELTGSRILQSWDLDPRTMGLRIEGRVQSVPIGETPGVETFGIAHGQASDSTLDWTIASHSQDAAELYADVNPSYTYEKHHWDFGATTEPSTGLGNTVPDHAYFVETQLIPKMAGIEATFSAADHGDGDWGNTDAAMTAFDDYESDTGQPESATRWHVATNQSPYNIPGNTGPDEIDEHVLTINWKRNNGNPDNSNGVGLWRVQEGARSVALLGDTGAGRANQATLSFDHFLRVEASDTDLCTSPSDTDCTMIRPSILFWNTTADRWTRLSQNATGCSPSGWDDMGDAQVTSNWERVSVDLCEGLKHTGSELWLSLFWDADCLDASGNNQTCSANQAPHGWFVDNIEVTADGSTVYETDFEPPTDRASQALFVSNGVDQERTHAPGPDPAEENTIAYIRNMVQDNGNVVALSPSDAPPGEWLSQVGLASTATSQSDAVTTEKPGNIVLGYPNELPETSGDYQQESISWVAGEPPTPTTWSLPGNLQALDVIQKGPDEATVLHGEPYPDGGRVAALSYNYTSFDNTTLREELWENLHGSSVYMDPTFEVGDELPEAGTSEIVSDRRVLLVSVTPDDTYVVPLEITMWLWQLG